jgi:hypothetical protein
MTEGRPVPRASRATKAGPAVEAIAAGSEVRGGVDLRTRISEALAAGRFDPDELERAVTDLLTRVYPGLSPVPGGTDFGRDADIMDGLEPPIRLLITRQMDVRANVRSGLRSMADKGVPVERVIVATSQELSETRREGLRKLLADEFGATLNATFDRRWLAAALYEDPAWRQRLVGIGGEIEGLVSRPVQLDRSPGGALPFIGREAAAAIAETTGDLVLIGSPGTGKSRVAAEQPGWWFVVDASQERVADAIRRIRPAGVVVDDATTRLAVVAYLVELRRQEVLDFTIVLIGWPEEREALIDALPGASPVEVGLLEPDAIDAIIQGLGVTGVEARSIVLDQAAGRPGWAVALAALVAADPDAVLTGRGLMAQVRPYVRRVGPAEEETLGVLANIAALEPLRDEELEAVAAILGVAEPRVRSILRKSMASGLIDQVGQGYAVRPIALGTALLASWFFTAPPMGSFDRLIEALPNRKLDLLKTSLRAAGAAPQALRIAERALDEGWFPATWLGQYARTDPAAAARAVQEVAAETVPPTTRAEVLKVAAAMGVDSAIDRLLELAIGDDRAQHSHTDHPVRVLGEIATAIHPDFGTAFGARRAILERAAAWADGKDTPETWAVLGAVAERLLDPVVHGVYRDPVEPNRIVLPTGVEPASRLLRIRDEVWPLVCDRLHRMPPRAVVPLVASLEDWGAVAAGFGGTAGDVPEDRRAAARIVAADIAADLIRAAEGSRGLTWRIARLDERYALGLGVTADPEFDLLMWPGYDHQPDESVPSRRERLADLGVRWAAEDPATVLAVIADLRAEAALARDASLPALFHVLSALAEAAENPLGWADAATASPVWPQAQPILRRAVQIDPMLSLPVLNRGLTGDARWSVLAVALGSPEPRVREVALVALERMDSRQVNYLVASGQVAEPVLEALLQHPVAQVRAAAAMACDMGRGQGPAVTPELEAAWRAAFIETADVASDVDLDYEITEVLDHLLAVDPALAVDWMLRRVDVGDDELVPYHWEPRLRELPRYERDRLMRSVTPLARDHVLGLLMGVDADWVLELLERGVADDDDALSALAGARHEGFDERTDVFEAIGSVLLARGLSADAIVHTSEFGTEWGGEAARAERRLRYFEGLSRRDEPMLAELGRAGVARYGPAHRQALAAEDHARITRQD